MSAGRLLYQELTDKVIGCAMAVHRYFGPGFLEIVYHRAMQIELKKNGIESKSEVERKIIYDGFFISKRRLDMIVEDKVLVEFKAAPFMDVKWSMTIINYLKVFEIEVGLILNFGASSLLFKRFYKPVKPQTIL
jgi:GxxExxY protein